MAKMNINVPHLSQRDNVRNPSGSCNVTCMAMLLLWAGYPKPTEHQLEDFLYNYAQTNSYSRHEGDDLAEIHNKFAEKESLDYRDRFTMTASIDSIKKQLTNAFPVVVHGYFTRSGHIILLRGFDDDAYEGKGAFIVNDPWGEWNEWGYNTGVSGEKLLYSYDMIKRLCTDPGKDNSIWAHILSKK